MIRNPVNTFQEDALESGSETSHEISSSQVPDMKTETSCLWVIDSWSLAEPEIITIHDGTPDKRIGLDDDIQAVEAVRNPANNPQEDALKSGSETRHDLSSSQVPEKTETPCLWVIDSWSLAEPEVITIDS